MPGARKKENCLMTVLFFLYEQRTTNREPPNYFITSFWTEVMALVVASSSKVE